MSVSLESWEGVANTVGRYFSKSMPPYYTSRYLEIAVEIIGDLLGKTSYTYVETCVSLPEPIWQEKNIVFFSVPMMSLFINQPVELPQDTVKYVARFDIFDRIEVDDTKNKSYDQDDVGSLRKRKRKNRNKRLESYDTSNGYIVNWNSTMIAGNVSDEFGLNESDTTVLVQLFRLVLMIGHWFQHASGRTTYRDHENFHEIEMADTDLYNALMSVDSAKTATTDESSSGSDNEPEYGASVFTRSKFSLDL